MTILNCHYFQQLKKFYLLTGLTVESCYKNITAEIFVSSNEFTLCFEFWSLSSLSKLNITTSVLLLLPLMLIDHMVDYGLLAYEGLRSSTLAHAHKPGA